MPHDRRYNQRLVAGAFTSWTVKMDAEEPEGRPLWEHSLLPPGKLILLEVMRLPEMAFTIGTNRDRKPNKPGPTANGEGVALWQNEGIVRVGPWPSSYMPLKVDCALYVTPAYQNQLISTETELPAPVDGGLEGLDLRVIQGHERDTLQIWTGVTQGSFDLIAPRIWLRHPSGQWGQAEPALPILSRATHVVNTRNSDRVYVSFTFSGVPSGNPVFIAYGNLTAPTNTLHSVRFGATVLE